ncbi:MAG TPA: peptide-N4-asparagine amidase [Thermoplasmata archaeon]|nr:peptide-N4-asparagine amidase [Thermoplasmata archaeon]
MAGSFLARVVPTVLLLVLILAVPPGPSAAASHAPMGILIHPANPTPRGDLVAGALANAALPSVRPTGPNPAGTASSAGPIPSASSPSSDVFETPSPAIPSTRPTTFVVATSLNCPPSCTPTLNVTAPAGPWALILLNYTGSIAPQVYDSSYHATVNGVPVLFGTTPEMYTWTVLKDLNEYSALFSRTVAFQFVLGSAVVTGHFVISVSLSFYPVPTGAPAPVVPDQVVPVWPFTSLSGTRPAASTNVTIPQDVQNATLEVYSYGFSGGGADEFWYASQPAYRAVGITVDGSPLATIQPFEYVNTGGLDLFLWDPVTGAYTANNVPYQVDVTAALGLIEGTHTFNASVLGLGRGSNWFVAGSLLLYTNSSILSASLTSDPAPGVVYSNGSSGGTPTESVTRSYSYASALNLYGGSEAVTSWTNETFSAAFPVFPAKNASGAFVTARTSFQESIVSPEGSTWRNSSSTPSIGFVAGQVFKQSSTTGGGYPIFGNITYTMYELFQNWNLTHTDTSVSSHGIRTVSASYSNDNVTANGTYVGEEEEISPSAAMILKITTFWSNNTKVYRSLDVAAPLGAWYNHTVTSQLTPADLTTDQAAVLVDSAQYTDAASLRPSALETDVGQPATVSVRSLGFGAPFSATWIGLPPGCSPTTSAYTLTCSPKAAGTFSVSIVLVGVYGQAAPAATLSWTVHPDPVVSVHAAPAIFDVGRPTNLSIAVTGGAAPVRCAWFANGVPIGPGTVCPMAFSYDPSSAGPVTVNVSLTDALGVTAANFTRLVVEPIGQAMLQFANPTNSPVPSIQVGDSLLFTTNVLGGVAPFFYHWFVNDASLGPGSSDANFTFQPTQAGTFTISSAATDADGITVQSASVTVDVTAHGGSGTPGGGSGGPPLGTEALVGVGVAGVAVILLVVVLVMRRPSRPPGSGGTD